MKYKLKAGNWKVLIEFLLKKFSKITAKPNKNKPIQLINEISKHYYQLYDEEERTATVKTIPFKDRKIYTRNQTNGKYGSWGHDIGDLVLDEIHVYKNASGEVILTLQLES